MKKVFCVSLQVFLLGFLFAGPVSAQQPVEPTVQDQALPLDDLRLFTLVFDHIRRSYVEPISDEQLLENAIKGMLSELDPHSAYLNSPEFSSLRESTKGEFSGVGLEIGSEDGYIKVITPIDGTPAYEAGLQAGDLIIELDKESLRGLSVSDTAKRMRGPVGTSVVLTIVRQGVSKPFDVEVVRDTIKLSSVRTRMLEDKFGYIRISQFQADTGREVVKSLSSLMAKNKNLQGLVLDLRNNPGGILQASVQVVDAFVNEGLIVYTEGRIGNSNQSYSATPGDISNGLPVVVLINGGSASAAEIVAGALQDSGRAVVMGTQSFGKGSVQTILPLDQTRGIKLTTARYFTPKGRSIQAQGILPDIVVNRATITEIDERRILKEADLAGHLENASQGEDGASGQDESSNVDDNQLFEAVNLLKGLAIFQRASQ